MTQTRVTVNLPPGTATKLEEAVKKGLYPSVEEAVLTGARLVAGLGPRARELLKEGSGADDFIRVEEDKDRGDWY